MARHPHQGKVITFVAPPSSTLLAKPVRPRRVQSSGAGRGQKSAPAARGLARLGNGPLLTLVLILAFLAGLGLTLMAVL